MVMNIPLCTCQSCNASVKIVIDLGKIENKSFDFEAYPKNSNSFEFELPTGNKITYKILSQQDENSMEVELNSLKKVTKDSKELTTRLKYLITSVNGNSDKAAIRKFVDDELSAKDSLAFRKKIREFNPDVDLTFNFVCSECGFERRSDVPIGATFLWPDLES